MNGESAEDLSGELVAVARAVKTRGLRGELIADLLTDFPERFEEVTRLVAVGADRQRFSLELEEHWFQGGRIVLKFAGYDSIEEAEKLVGCELTVPESESVELAEDEYYHWQLQGCRVETVTGQLVGTVREVLETGAAPILVVENDEGRESLIPLAAEICVEIDPAHKTVRVDPPEGLLE